MLVSLQPNSIFFNELNDVFDDLSQSFKSRTPFKNTGNTAVNIKENDQKFSIELTAPGFEKENFNVFIETKTLVVKGEISKNQETNEGYKHKEFHAKSFERRFALPENIDEEGIKAEYKNGILLLEIPRKPAEKPKEIHVKIS